MYVLLCVTVVSFWGFSGLLLAVQNSRVRSKNKGTVNWMELGKFLHGAVLQSEVGDWIIKSNAAGIQSSPNFLSESLFDSSYFYFWDCHVAERDQSLQNSASFNDERVKIERNRVIFFFFLLDNDCLKTPEGISRGWRKQAGQKKTIALNGLW